MCNNAKSRTGNSAEEAISTKRIILLGNAHSHYILREQIIKRPPSFSSVLCRLSLCEYHLSEYRRRKHSVQLNWKNDAADFQSNHSAIFKIVKNG